jgi:hypothetical protein
MEQGFDLLGMMSHVIEIVEERIAKILWPFREPIMCHMLAGVIPDPFGRIEFRPVRRKLEDFHVAAVGFEPKISPADPQMGVKVGDLTAERLDELTNGTGAPVIGTVQNLGPIVDVCLGCGLIRLH